MAESRLPTRNAPSHPNDFDFSGQKYAGQQQNCIEENDPNGKFENHFCDGHIDYVNEHVDQNGLDSQFFFFDSSLVDGNQKSGEIQKNQKEKKRKTKKKNNQHFFKNKKGNFNFGSESQKLFSTF
jgi:hypothetical protein